MALTQTKVGIWLLDIRPLGLSGPRIRKRFKRKADALAEEIYIKGQYQKNPDWAPPKKDSRTLLDLCNEWYAAHGYSLKDGSRRLKKLENLCLYLENPVAANFTASDFTKYRLDRVEDGVSENTVNHEHAYLAAVFSELMRIGSWDVGNPLQNIRKFKLDEQELSYLSNEQIKILFEMLPKSENPHLSLLAEICLRTGCRFGEAESLRIGQVRRDSIQFTATKTGKNRVVRIDDGLADKIKVHHKIYGNEQIIFGPSHRTFCAWLEKCGFDLPAGQATHVLRHTFASHFIQKTGNVLYLQRILGHTNIKTTMRYAHCAPDHTADALIYNPLALIEKEQDADSVGLV